MDEFLLEYKNIITFSVEILATGTGLFFYKKYKHSTTKYFIWFLVYLTICDVFGGYVNHINHGVFNFLEGTAFVKNYWWSTLFWKIGAIVFFAFYYGKVLKTLLFKNILKICNYSFLMFSIVYILFNWEDYFVRYFPVISLLGALIIFLCAVFYFIEVLQSDRILTFYKAITFYISVAIFLWWLIVTPLVFYDIYNSSDWNFIFLRWKIFLFANIFMYTTYTFALIWCKAEND